MKERPKPEDVIDFKMSVREANMLRVALIIAQEPQLAHVFTSFNPQDLNPLMYRLRCLWFTGDI